MRQITQSELDGQMESHQLWWRSGMTQGARLDLRELTMIGLSLANKGFPESNWSSVTGRNLDLSNARFARSRFRNVSLQASRMPEAIFNDCDMEGVDFTDSDMAGADLSLSFAAKSKGLTLRNVNLSGGFICKSWIVGSDFDGTNFENANLSKTMFEGCSFRNVNFKNANLMKTEFLNTDLRGADFTGARALYTRFECARINGIKGEMLAGRPDLEEEYWVQGKGIDLVPEGDPQFTNDIAVLRSLLISRNR